MKNKNKILGVISSSLVFLFLLGCAVSLDQPREGGDDTFTARPSILQIGNEISVSWTQNSLVATQYEVIYSKDRALTADFSNATLRKFQRSETSETTIPFKGEPALESGIPYYVWIYAKKANNEVVAKLPSQEVYPYKNFLATPPVTAATGAEMSWPEVPGATSYEVFQGTTSTARNVPTTSFTFLSLEDGAELSVYAYDKDGDLIGTSNTVTYLAQALIHMTGNAGLFPGMIELSWDKWDIITAYQDPSLINYSLVTSGLSTGDTASLTIGTEIITAPFSSSPEVTLGNLASAINLRNIPGITALRLGEQIQLSGSGVIIADKIEGEVTISGSSRSAENPTKESLSIDSYRFSIGSDTIILPFVESHTSTPFKVAGTVDGSPVNVYIRNSAAAPDDLVSVSIQGLVRNKEYEFFVETIKNGPAAKPTTSSNVFAMTARGNLTIPDVSASPGSAPYDISLSWKKEVRGTEEFVPTTKTDSLGYKYSDYFTAPFIYKVLLTRPDEGRQTGAEKKVYNTVTTGNSQPASDNVNITDGTLTSGSDPKEYTAGSDHSLLIKDGDNVYATTFDPVNQNYYVKPYTITVELYSGTELFASRSISNVDPTRAKAISNVSGTWDNEKYELTVTYTRPTDTYDYYERSSNDVLPNVPLKTAFSGTQKFTGTSSSKSEVLSDVADLDPTKPRRYVQVWAFDGDKPIGFGSGVVVVQDSGRLSPVATPGGFPGIVSLKWDSYVPEKTKYNIALCRIGGGTTCNRTTGTGYTFKQNVPVTSDLEIVLRNLLQGATYDIKVYTEVKRGTVPLKSEYAVVTVPNVFILEDPTVTYPDTINEFPARYQLNANLSVNIDGTSTPLADITEDYTTTGKTFSQTFRNVDVLFNMDRSSANYGANGVTFNIRTRWIDSGNYATSTNGTISNANIPVYNNSGQKHYRKRTDGGTSYDPGLE